MLPDMASNMVAHADVSAVPPAATAIVADASTSEAAADDGSTEVTTIKAGMDGGIALNVVAMAAK